MSLDCTINNILNYNFTVLDSFAADRAQHAISQHIIIQPLPFFVTAYLKNYAHWILLSKCSWRKRNVEWLVWYCRNQGSWAELELEAMNDHDSVAKTVVNRSTSEQNSTRLANTDRSTVLRLQLAADYSSSCMLHARSRIFERV